MKWFGYPDKLALPYLNRKKKEKISTNKCVVEFLGEPIQRNQAIGNNPNRANTKNLGHLGWPELRDKELQWLKHLKGRGLNSLSLLMGVVGPQCLVFDQDGNVVKKLR